MAETHQSCPMLPSLLPDVITIMIIAMIKMDTTHVGITIVLINVHRVNIAQVYKCMCMSQILTTFVTPFGLRI